MNFDKYGINGEGTMRIYIIFFAVLLLSQCVSSFAVEFTVSTDKTYDDINPGDGACFTGHVYPDTCTLRAAIQEANALAGLDKIVFDRPLSLPYPNLPEITDALTIDGSSQWEMEGTMGYRPAVSISADQGIVIAANNVTIIGLMFYGECSIGEAGVKLLGGNEVRIGGPGTHERNVFISETGILFDSSHETVGPVTIQYNYFGIIHKFAGPYLGDNEYRSEMGIYNSRSSQSLYMNTIVIEHNLIGECREGIFWDGPGSVIIQNNNIGTPDVNGYFKDRFPNWIGIYIGFDTGSVVIKNNQIAENRDYQIDVKASTAYQTVTIQENTIGSYKTDYSVSSSRGDGINIGVSNTNLNITDNLIQNINGNGMSIGVYNGQANNTNIQGNTIGGNKKNGIALSGMGTVEERIIVSSNRIWSNGESGILLNDAHYYVVAKNTIGIATGYDFDAGNGLDGIRIVNGSTENLIGGAVSEDGNVIGCNKGNGIYIGGAGTRDNDVAGNIIGSAEDSVGFRKAGNHQHGIALYDNAEANNIGLSGDIINANIILDSHWRGIAVINSNHNRIFGNLVGTDKGSRNWGNGYSGIQVVGNNNEVKYNTVAFNGYGSSQPQAGIAVEGASSYGNRLSENSIFHNGGAGIDLVDGGNQSLQPPLIARNGQILSGTTYPSAMVEFFSGAEEDEGKYFEGSTQADISGNFNWQINAHVKGKFITATTTNPQVFNTSEFSVSVQGYSFPWPMFLPAIISGKQ